MYRWRWSRKRSKELRLTKTIVPSLMNFISRNWLHNWWASQPPIQTPCFYTISLSDWPPRIHMVDRMLVYVGSVPMSCKNRRSFCGNVFGFSNNPPPIITPPFFNNLPHTYQNWFHEPFKQLLSFIISASQILTPSSRTINRIVSLPLHTYLLPIIDKSIMSTCIAMRALGAAVIYCVQFTWLPCIV